MAYEGPGQQPYNLETLNPKPNEPLQEVEEDAEIKGLVGIHAQSDVNRSCAPHPT